MEENMLELRHHPLPVGMTLYEISCLMPMLYGQTLTSTGIYASM